MSSTRRRLDQALVERRLVESRSRARALIMAGQVRIAGQQASKPGALVADEEPIEVASPPRFVGRGGDKLAAALDASAIDVAGRTCLDIGASTGGFTDCLLQAGAACVVAVDVGYGQLEYRLRRDPRVRPLERLNARYLTAADMPADVAPPSLLVIDVAFISVAKILPAVSSVCAELADALVLVKPQFECGPGQVGTGGVVASSDVRRRTVRTVALAALDLGWDVVGAIASPIRGQSGNWECFLQLARPPSRARAASLEGVLDGVEIPEG